eukprot:Awhi_evm1s15529
MFLRQLYDIRSLNRIQREEILKLIVHHRIITPLALLRLAARLHLQKFFVPILACCLDKNFAINHEKQHNQDNNPDTHGRLDDNNINNNNNNNNNYNIVDHPNNLDNINYCNGNSNSIENEKSVYNPIRNNNRDDIYSGINYSHGHSHGHGNKSFCRRFQGRSLSHSNIDLYDHGGSLNKNCNNENLKKDNKISFSNTTDKMSHTSSSRSFSTESISIPLNEKVAPTTTTTTTTIATATTTTTATRASNIVPVSISSTVSPSSITSSLPSLSLSSSLTLLNATTSHSPVIRNKFTNQRPTFSYLDSHHQNNTQLNPTASFISSMSTTAPLSSTVLDTARMIIKMSIKESHEEIISRMLLENFITGVEAFYLACPLSNMCCCKASLIFIEHFQNERKTSLTCRESNLTTTTTTNNNNNNNSNNNEEISIENNGNNDNNDSSNSSNNDNNNNNYNNNNYNNNYNGISRNVSPFVRQVNSHQNQQLDHATTSLCDDFHSLSQNKIFSSSSSSSLSPSPSSSSSSSVSIKDLLFEAIHHSNLCLLHALLENKKISLAYPELRKEAFCYMKQKQRRIKTKIRKIHDDHDDDDDNDINHHHFGLKNRTSRDKHNHVFPGFNTTIDSFIHTNTNRNVHYCSTNSPCLDGSTNDIHSTTNNYSISRHQQQINPYYNIQVHPHHHHPHHELTYLHSTCSSLDIVILAIRYSKEQQQKRNRLQWLKKRLSLMKTNKVNPSSTIDCSHLNCNDFFKIHN